ncbi:hypothetical protein PRUPE_2G180100 [Prunus persica]|uniref:Uncharacterized protein n=1 Tax=Prunus persica TaxID=3760 RepID=A0A251QHN7_PRUPE|nr:hypothetical protein PRUPE_2G180100 [Prunus persica]
MQSLPWASREKIGKSITNISGACNFQMSVLVALIPIKFPGISMLSSPFETHCTTTMVAIASLLAYSSAVAARLRFPTYSPTNFRLAIIFSALLSVASLLSLLFPDSWHHIPYVIFVFYYFMAEVSSVLYIPFSFLFLCNLFFFQVLTPYHLSKTCILIKLDTSAHNLKLC